MPVNLLEKDMSRWSMFERRSKKKEAKLGLIPSESDKLDETNVEIPSFSPKVIAQGRLL